jgi:oligoendopeptidase F
MMSPRLRKQAVVVMRSEVAVSERRACGLIQIYRGTYRYRRRPEEFFPCYERLLEQSGALSVEEAGLVMGLDLTKKDFWKAALGDFEQMADEFERLTEDGCR